MENIRFILKYPYLIPQWYLRVNEQLFFPTNLANNSSIHPATRDELFSFLKSPPSRTLRFINPASKGSLAVEKILSFNSRNPTRTFAGNYQRNITTLPCCKYQIPLFTNILRQLLSWIKINPVHIVIKLSYV